MDPSHGGWGPPPQQQASGNAHGGSNEQNQSEAPRPTYGVGHQSPPQGHSGLPPPPSSGPFPHFHQQPPSLASLAGIGQSPPRQPPPSAGRPEGAPQGPPQLPLPGFNQATGQQSAAEREREREAEQMRHIKLEEDRRRQQERQRLEQIPAHQPQPGPPMPLHQPVAVGPRSVHGPNGLLGTPGQPPPHTLPGVPAGPGTMFAGGPVQQPTQGQGPAGQQMQQGMLMPFPQAAPPPPTQQQANQQQGQGQQPILNDALSYLDQVKVQFAEVPDVYNRFLDIMKDFKSGAIDTPGVIGRVSTLFAGNPDLIQGFNTFLPPGYRIECGTDNDPNTIRVTTPMGTTVRAMPQPRPLSRQDGADQDGLRLGNGSFTPQPGQNTQMYSPSGRPVGPAGPGQQQHLEAVRQQEQQAMHQQEQRGISSLSNAVSAAPGPPGVRPGGSPRSTSLPAMQDHNAQVDGAAGQSAMDKRGPVEFNHAISYVNKIKNRFASHPDIYKQFLEILQTYQRESKPIQDVYSQVTHLFKTAPDLLEDFKQFLPESAAQAKAAERARQQAEENVMLSNVRGEPMYGSPVNSREPQVGTPSHARSNLPPVGNFAFTPVGKDNKRKRNDRQGTAGSVIDPGTGPSGAKMNAYGAQPVKRMKQTHAPAVKGLNEQQQPPPSPTLIPELPQPLPPTNTSAATHEELQFFDRAKKAIGNKNTMNEFLKLLNLFSNDYIDRTTLIYRARAFLGNTPELIKWFCDFVGYDEKDVVIENKAREPIVPGGRISLSNCRAMGPSYRLLPKRERNKLCSGRDELCNSVLNDEWASHPTWASEDSGFIVHRKNVHEEGLHRIEEERHDYDYNIEACARTIQLIQPIAQQLRRMAGTEEEIAFRLPPSLGGQSDTIYKRVIMKMYGRERGAEVIKQLHLTPYQVIPVLLNRLHERLSSWKMAQREWEKVWREQTQKMFWKSLDHQAVNAKVNDRRQFQVKALQAEAQVRLEEQKNQQKIVGSLPGLAQIAVDVTDEDVLVDAAWLVLVHNEAVGTADSARLGPFIQEFVPLFFGIPADEFEHKLSERRRIETSSRNSMERDDLTSGAEDSGNERRTKKNAKQSTLLRQTLDKGPKGRLLGRREREDSNASASRASTPGLASEMGDDGLAVDGMAVDVAGTGAVTPADDSNQKIADSTQRWFNHPATGNAVSSDKNVEPNAQHKRVFYRLWGNPSIYCFVRMFLILYERLHALKQGEADCKAIVQQAKRPKAAIELGIMDKLPSDFFHDTSANANYYQQMLQKFYEVIQQELDFVNDGVEDCLRRYYLQAGYPLYAFEKLMAALVRYGGTVVVGEAVSKEKSWEMIGLWKKDKARGDEINAQQTLDYRKAAEKLIGSQQDVYAIDWDIAAKKVKIYLVKKDDPYCTAPVDGLSQLDKENNWRHYVASYSSMDSTDAVDTKHLHPVMLSRNMATIGADPASGELPLQAITNDSAAEASTDDASAAGASADTPAKQRLFDRFWSVNNAEDLSLRIDVEKYKIHFQPGTSEAFIQPMRARQGGEEGVRDAEEGLSARLEVMKEKIVGGHEGVKELGEGVVEAREREFEGLVKGEDVKVEGAEGGDGMEVDS